MDRQNKKKQSHMMIRISDDDKSIIIENAKRNNFNSVSEYLRFLGMNTTIEVKLNDKKDNT